MRVTLISGSAGVGKTWRCVEEIRACLRAAPEGSPLILLTPKPGTYQLECSLLSDPDLAGYTRLHIFSFERLASWCLDQMSLPVPDCLDEEGRVMVLRALLGRHDGALQIFRASARLNGFSRQLSKSLSEFQHQGVGPDVLRQLSQKCADQQHALSRKLADMAHIMEAYRDWLTQHGLRDAETLVSEAARALAAAGEPGATTRVPHVVGLWVDGFMDFTFEQLELLAGLLPGCDEAAFTFCLEGTPSGKRSWLSKWSAVARAHELVSKRLAAVPGAVLQTDLLPRGPNLGRFARSLVLQHMDAAWDAAPSPAREFTPDDVRAALRTVVCPDREQEVVEAAREIIRFVRQGGRYRDAMILVRNLEPYHAILQRVLARYEIPFFLDRRESVAQHPLAELTRGALRTVELGWKHEDWFAVLKTGLCDLTDEEADLLENETLQRGWQGDAWKACLRIAEDPELEKTLERIRRRVVPSVGELGAQLQGRVTGWVLAEALRGFWEKLGVADRLGEWAVGTQQSGAENAGATHLSVLDQMESWLRNVELGFGNDALSLRDWLPIVETGLAALTVGVIPPALDQVVIGAVDRSRTPDVALAIVLGLNEGVFPASPAADPVLNDSDRETLGRLGLELGATVRAQLGRERYLGYIACTRPRQRLVLTCAAADGKGKMLNTSALLSHVRSLFPALPLEELPAERDWRESVHPCELAVPWLEHQSREAAASGWDLLRELPQMGALRLKLGQLANPPPPEQIDPALARALYGAEINTSISRMEQFAACPFKFFAHSGLRADERRRFELDFRERGTFLHDVLARFHQELAAQNRRWSDLTPAAARDLIEQIALQVADQFSHGLLQSSCQTRFMTQAMIAILRDFIEVSVEWMRRQYRFHPVAVEVPFGDGDDARPAWTIELPNGCRLRLRGRIDRIDLLPLPENPRTALLVIIDYKSKAKPLDSLLVENGLQLQLLSYLNTVAQWDPKLLGDFDELRPAGVFFAPLHARYASGAHRGEALENPAEARLLAYQHAGRFAAEFLPHLDAREAPSGDQFKYRRIQGGGLHKGCKDAVTEADLAVLQQTVEGQLRTMGARAFEGDIQVDPYKRNSSDYACVRCEYQSICRIDPATHVFRKLQKPA